MESYVSYTADGVIKYPPHKHNCWEIMLYTEGDGYMFTEIENIQFSKGTIIIMPPGIVHGSVSQNGFKNISIRGNFESYFFFTHPTALSDNAICEGTRLAKLIYDSRSNDKNYIETLIKSYILFILQYIKFSSPANRAIDKIISHIRASAFDSEFNITDVLKQSGYSEDYVREQFKKETGTHPKNFLANIRIKHAQLLIDIYGKSMSLSDISEKCGYNDYAYFSKQFKKHTGLSPSVYLKSI